MRTQSDESFCLRRMWAALGWQSWATVTMQSKWKPPPPMTWTKKVHHLFNWIILLIQLFRAGAICYVSVLSFSKAYVSVPEGTLPFNYLMNLLSKGIPIVRNWSSLESVFRTVPYRMLNNFLRYLLYVFGSVKIFLLFWSLMTKK